jgi:hypothetical protein
MTELAKVQKLLKEYQGRDVAEGRPRFLFRGQRAAYPGIKPTFSRIPTDEIEISQAYMVYRHAKQICQGLRGYTIDHLDGVAVLQHYGWPTPLVDLTGTLEVAIFFALYGASAGSRAVIYLIDSQKLPEQSLVVDHSFLTHAVADGGLRHRWLRQDGFAVTTRQWRVAPDAREFDLLAPPFCYALEPHEFTVSDTDQCALPDVLSTARDPIPRHLQNLLQLFCHDTFGGSLSPKLVDVVKGIWPANTA